MSWWSEMMQGIPLNAVLKERLALAEQKFKDIEAENSTLKEKASALTTENEALKQKLASFEVAAVTGKPKVKGGCYVFEGDDNLYCPACFDTKGKKHLCTRTVAKTYRCCVCKIDLG